MPVDKALCTHCLPKMPHNFGTGLPMDNAFLYNFFFSFFQITESTELEFFETSARTGEGVTEVGRQKIRLFNFHRSLLVTTF